MSTALSVPGAADLEVADQVLLKRFDDPSDAPAAQTLPYQQADMVTVSGGQLRLNPTGELYFDLRQTGSAYATRLRENAGRVTWAFNVTRTGAGSRFTVALAGAQVQLKTPGGFGYYVEAISDSGTVVLRRFALPQYRNTQPRDLVVAPDLLPAGVVGSFRVTYDPKTDGWAFYGGAAGSDSDPLTEDRLLGNATDGDGTGGNIMSSGQGLNYLALQAEGTGAVIFDNLAVTAITRPNRPPVLADDIDATAMVLTGMYGPYYHYFPLWNDSDPDGDALEIVTISPFRSGFGYGRSFGLEYYPNALDPQGEDLYLLVGDGHGGLASEHVTFGDPKKKVYSTLEPHPDDFVVLNDDPVVLDVLRNDILENGPPCRPSIQWSSEPWGAAQVQPDGKILYTPLKRQSEVDYEPPYMFSYELQTPTGRTNSVMVHVAKTLKGAFQGAVRLKGGDSATGELRVLGEVRITLTATGSYTGAVRVSEKMLSFSGTLDTAFGAHHTISLPKGRNLDLAIKTDPFQPLRAVNVEIALEGAVYTGTLRRQVSPWTKDLKGQYNLLLPGDDHPAEESRGMGYGILHLSASGKVRLIGRMPDGAWFSSAAGLQATDAIQFYSPLRSVRGNKAGQVGGQIRFLKHARTSDCGGTLDWYRPAVASPAGARAGSCVQRVFGSRYFPRPSGSNTTGLPTGAKDVFLELREGRMGKGIVSRVSVNGTEMHQEVGDKDLGIKGVFRPRSGLWSGKFRDPATGTSTFFSGVVFPSQQAAGALFLQEGKGGSAVLYVPRP